MSFVDKALTLSRATWAWSTPVDTPREADTMATMGGKQARAKRARRQFTDEFRAGAVRVVLSEGKTVAQVARDLDLTPSALSG